MIFLTMIVRDESASIARTLASVKDYIDGWCIVDTGSKDRTPQLIVEAMRGVPGELCYTPFVDFATARNQALDFTGIIAAHLAMDEPESRWALMLSGDAVVSRASDLRRLTAIADARGLDAVSLDIHNAGLLYQQDVLIRLDSGARYRGVTHEYLAADKRADGRDLIADVPVVTYPPVRAADKRVRWILDTNLLAAEYHKQRERGEVDGRTVFYLAQSHECLGSHGTAAALYAQRVGILTGHWEERAVAALRQARCRWRLSDPDALIRDAFDCAIELAPDRAEARHEFAKYLFETGRAEQALPHAEAAAALPLPTKSRLFIERDVYAGGAKARLDMIRAALSARAA